MESTSALTIPVDNDEDMRHGQGGALDKEKASEDRLQGHHHAQDVPNHARRLVRVFGSATSLEKVDDTTRVNAYRGFPWSGHEIEITQPWSNLQLQNQPLVLYHTLQALARQPP